jgi:hypothetical protein
MRLVVIESPYRARWWWQRWKNIDYAKACLMDSLYRGEAPIASHLLYPQVLDDFSLDERTLGIHAGWAWRGTAEATIVYEDLGISEGMRLGIEDSRRVNVPVEYRRLGAPYI